jgi:ubiquinone/menaquinone biosynthesis C-methylase UbiE
MQNAFLNPEDILETWSIHPGERVADFGCGSGFFAVAAAKLVGPSGKVYALDVQPESLEATRSRARLNNINNIEYIRVDLETPEGSHLGHNSIDKILISNILFQAENMEAVIKESYRVLKKGGSALLIEWNEEISPAGPPLDHRVSQGEAETLCKNEKFSQIREIPAGEHHYGLVCTKENNE